MAVWSHQGLQTPRAAPANRFPGGDPLRFQSNKSAALKNDSSQELSADLCTPKDYTQFAGSPTHQDILLQKTSPERPGGVQEQKHFTHELETLCAAIWLQ